MTALAQGVPRNKPQTAFMQRGTTPLNVWYCGAQNQTAFGTAAYGTGTLSAGAFVLSRAVTLKKLSFEVTTGGAAGSKARVGIYAATSMTNLYPSTLVVDGGEFDSTLIQVNTTAVNIQMAAGLYWRVLLTGTANPTLRDILAGEQNPMLGVVNTLATPNSALTVAQAYGALPATYPAGGVASNFSIPVVALEFA